MSNPLDFLTEKDRSTFGPRKSSVFGLFSAKGAEANSASAVSASSAWKGTHSAYTGMFTNKSLGVGGGWSPTSSKDNSISGLAGVRSDANTTRSDASPAAVAAAQTSSKSPTQPNVAIIGTTPLAFQAWRGIHRAGFVVSHVVHISDKPYPARTGKASASDRFRLNRDGNDVDRERTATAQEHEDEERASDFIRECIAAHQLPPAPAQSDASNKLSDSASSSPSHNEIYMTRTSNTLTMPLSSISLHTPERPTVRSASDSGAVHTSDTPRDLRGVVPQSAYRFFAGTLPAEVDVVYFAASHIPSVIPAASTPLRRPAVAKRSFLDDTPVQQQQRGNGMDGIVYINSTDSQHGRALKSSSDSSSDTNRARLFALPAQNHDSSSTATAHAAGTEMLLAEDNEDDLRQGLVYVLKQCIVQSKHVLLDSPCVAQLRISELQLLGDAVMGMTRQAKVLLLDGLLCQYAKSESMRSLQQQLGIVASSSSALSSSALRSPSANGVASQQQSSASSVKSAFSCTQTRCASLSSATASTAAAWPPIVSGSNEANIRDGSTRTATATMRTEHTAASDKPEIATAAAQICENDIGVGNLHRVALALFLPPSLPLSSSTAAEVDLPREHNEYCAVARAQVPSHASGAALLWFGYADRRSAASRRASASNTVSPTHASSVAKPTRGVAGSTLPVVLNLPGRHALIFALQLLHWQPPLSVMARVLRRGDISHDATEENSRDAVWMMEGWLFFLSPTSTHNIRTAASQDSLTSRDVVTVHLLLSVAPDMPLWQSGELSGSRGVAQLNAPFFELTTSPVPSAGPNRPSSSSAYLAVLSNISSNSNIHSHSHSIELDSCEEVRDESVELSYSVRKAHTVQESVNVRLPIELSTSCAQMRRWQHVRAQLRHVDEEDDAEEEDGLVREGLDNYGNRRGGRAGGRGSYAGGAGRSHFGFNVPLTRAQRTRMVAILNKGDQRFVLRDRAESVEQLRRWWLVQNTLERLAEALTVREQSSGLYASV